MTIKQRDSVTFTETASARAKHGSRLPGYHRPDIQGLRAVAVILVVSYHAGLPVSGGFVGVDDFFVISGFVIGGLLIRELAATGTVLWRKFFLRRARRLIPALSLMLSVGLILSALLLSPLSKQQEAAGAAASWASVSLANFYFFRFTRGYFDASAEGNPFLHTWSLSLEENFYLPLPLALAALWFVRRGRRREISAAPLVVLAAASLLLCLLFTPFFVESADFLGEVRQGQLRWFAGGFDFFSPFTRAWEFLAGVVIAVIVSRRSIHARFARVAAPLGALLLVGAAFGLNDSMIYPAGWALLPVAAAGLLILAGSADHTVGLPSGLGASPMVRVGDLSYSWYLWHWPLIVFAGAVFSDSTPILVAAAAASLLPAWLSNRFVEEPIHRGRRCGSTRSLAMLTAICVALPLTGGAASAHASANKWRNERVSAVRAFWAEEWPGYYCDYDVPHTKESCTWPVDNSKGTILLVGNSHAGALSGPAIKAANRLGYTLETDWIPMCPFAATTRVTVHEVCREYLDDRISAILDGQADYSAVLIATTMSQSPFDATYYTAPEDPAGSDESEEQSAQRWAEAEAETVARFSSRVPTLVFGDFADVPNVPECVVPALWRERSQDCGSSGPALAARRLMVAETEARALRDVGAHFFDLGALLCKGSDDCQAVRDGSVLQGDGSHVTSETAMTFTGPIEREIRRLLE